MEKDIRLQQIRELVNAGQPKRQDSVFDIHNNQSITINFISHDDKAQRALKSQVIGGKVK